MVKLIHFTKKKHKKLFNIHYCPTIELAVFLAGNNTSPKKVLFFVKQIPEMLLLNSRLHSEVSFILF